MIKQLLLTAGLLTVGMMAIATPASAVSCEGDPHTYCGRCNSQYSQQWMTCVDDCNEAPVDQCTGGGTCCQ